MNEMFVPLNLEQMYATTDISVFQRIIKSEKYPTFMILHGPCGTGKTTIARIIASNILKLDQEAHNALMYKRPSDPVEIYGYYEQDFQNHGRADDIRKLVDTIKEVSEGDMLGLHKSVFVMDEFDQALPETQRKVAKPLDDIRNVHVIICTNYINHVNDAVISRGEGYIFGFYELGKKAAARLIADTAKKMNGTIDQMAADNIYNQVQIRTPRSLILSTESYIQTGNLPTSHEKEMGLVKNYITRLKDLFEMKLKKINDKESLNPIVNNLYIACERLIIAKRTLDAALYSIAKYYDLKIRSDTDKYIWLSFFALTIRNYNKKSVIGLSYPVIELMRLSYEIVEERCKSEENNK